MSHGQRFVDKCLTSQVHDEPWPYQVIEDTLEESIFQKLRQQCEPHLTMPITELVQITPTQFKDYGIDFIDETQDICEKLFANIKAIHDVYPNYRHYPNMGINVHISVAPPLPWKFYIHQEGIEKTWSSVTYITPDDNVGTKMYSKQNENNFIKEAKWKPNSTFIFCGQQNKTWHSYESNQTSNRITLNFFIMKVRKGKCFFTG